MMFNLMKYIPSSINVEWARPTEKGKSNNEYRVIPTLRELRFLSTSILLNIILFPALFYSFPAYSAQDILQAGLNAYENGDYLEAIENFEASITAVSKCEEKFFGIPENIGKDEPDCGSEGLWDARFCLAASYFLVEKNKQAIEQFIEAQEMDANRRPDQQIFDSTIISLYSSDLPARLKCLEEYGNLLCINIEDTTKGPGGESKPIWKKWYTWVGAAVLVGLAVSSSSGSDDEGDDETVVVVW